MHMHIYIKKKKKRTHKLRNFEKQKKHNLKNKPK